MFKLLKLEKNGTLKEIEKRRLKPDIFDKEEKMRDFFAKNNNLNNFFSSFHYLISEKKINSKAIVDTVAFNPDDRTFAFFEYKLESEAKLNQIVKYKEDLNNNYRKKLFNWAINKYYLKNGLEAPTDLNEYQKGWEIGPKLVVINSQSRNKWEGFVTNTSFVEVGAYDLEKSQYFYVETIDAQLFSQTRREKKMDETKTNEQIIPPSTTKEQIYLWLLEKKNSSKQVEKWFLEVVRYVSNLKEPYLDEKYWYYSVVYKWKGKRVLVIKPQKQSFSIYLENNEITQKLKYLKSGWWADDLKRKKAVKDKEEDEFSKIFKLVKDYLKKVLV